MRHLPAFPTIDAIDLFAGGDAAKQVGGDSCNFFEVGKRTDAFPSADVSGKGMAGTVHVGSKDRDQHYTLSRMELAAALAAANDYPFVNNEAACS